MRPYNTYDISSHSSHYSVTEKCERMTRSLDQMEKSEEDNLVFLNVSPCHGETEIVEEMTHLKIDKNYII